MAPCVVVPGVSPGYLGADTEFISDDYVTVQLASLPKAPLRDPAAVLPRLVALEVLAKHEITEQDLVLRGVSPSAGQARPLIPCGAVIGVDADQSAGCLEQSL